MITPRIKPSKFWNHRPAAGLFVKEYRQAKSDRGRQHRAGAHHAGQQPGARAARVKAVIELAHALGLNVVAEGVETEGQAAVLRGKRCDKLQGFLFARPMPAQALTDWALSRRADDGSLRFSASVYAELDDGA